MTQDEDGCGECPGHTDNVKRSRGITPTLCADHPKRPLSPSCGLQPKRLLEGVDQGMDFIGMIGRRLELLKT